MDDPLPLAGSELRPRNHLLMVRYEPRGDPALFNEKGHFDLKLVCERLGPIASLPRRFSSIVMRDKRLHCAALVSYTGSMTIVGRQRYSKMMHCARVYLRHLARALGTPFLRMRRGHELHNVVMTWKKEGTRLSLHKMLGMRGIQYEPEQMNKVVWRPWGPHSSLRSVAVNLYFPGGVVITGAKSKRDVIKTRNRLESLLPGLMIPEGGEPGPQTPGS